MIRLVIPSLFEPHMLQALDSACNTQLDALQAKLKKADHRAVTNSNLYEYLYALSDEGRYATPWMLKADGVNTEENQYWLRADPVILEATHNGIVCRGNAILHLDTTEREELETILNDHFQADGLRFQFQSSSHGYVASNKQIDVALTHLPDVLGQDITHYLPAGNDGRYWQQVLMEIQMLLHRSECNERRRESGEKTVDGLWLWGNHEKPNLELINPDSEQFYTNNLVLAEIFDEHLTGDKVPDIKTVIDSGLSTEILFAQLEEACVQNDTITWQAQWSELITNFIQPALAALDKGQIKRLELVTEESHYLCKPWHRWRFWA